MEGDQKVILSSRAKRSDLFFEPKIKDCFGKKRLAMTMIVLFGHPQAEPEINYT